MITRVNKLKLSDSIDNQAKKVDKAETKTYVNLGG